MGNPHGFLKVKRAKTQYRPVRERISDFKEIPVQRNPAESQEQASRCMDCGVPFCHYGCPVGTVIPEWNDAMYQGRWHDACTLLQQYNVLPEITGRLCPALCESACVLGKNDDAVTCRENELAIIEYAFNQGWIQPRPPAVRSGKRVAVIGSGPAGLAAASSINRFGHEVVVFERDDHIGGILRYGIPDFKLEKWILDRRIQIFEKEGIVFKRQVCVGVDYPVKRLLQEFHAVCLTGGCRVPRDLIIAGRESQGIHVAMDYLIQRNRINAGLPVTEPLISAAGKKVLVIGGGDTGADCVGTAHREGACGVVQIELLPKPPELRPPDMPWPRYPLILRTATSHEEGGERQWSILTKQFVAEHGRIKKVHCVRVTWGPERDTRGQLVMKEMPDSAFEIEADLVILAMGFIYPEKQGLLEGFGVTLTERGTVYTDDAYMTSVPGVFAAGDMRRGASLVVWAIDEGIRAAQSIHRYVSAV